MTAAKSLLDRLISANPRDAHASDERSVRQAVRAHLQVLLNARQGYSASAPDYGIADFTELFRDSMDRTHIENEIRRAIERYEPRLQNVWVDLEQDEESPLELRFEIRGSIIYGDKQLRADFVSTIDPSGTIKVR